MEKILIINVKERRKKHLKTSIRSTLLFMAHPPPISFFLSLLCSISGAGYDKQFVKNSGNLEHRSEPLSKCKILSNFQRLQRLWPLTVRSSDLVSVIRLSSGFTLAFVWALSEADVWRLSFREGLPLESCFEFEPRSSGSVFQWPAC